MRGKSRPGTENPSVKSGPDGEATLLVAGDWAPIRAFDPMIKDGPESVYGDMLPVLRAADLRIVNCECALTSRRKPVWKSGSTFKGLPEHVKGMTVVPFEVACLANNHVFDYGISGFRESLNLLHRNGIKTVGAGLNGNQAFRPLTLEVKKSRIHIINISEGEDLTAARGGPGVAGWDLSRVLGLIGESRKSGGFVLVIGHCGLEYVPYPPPYVVSAFRAMVDAGAGCVIGHHPHVPQGIEWYKGRPIAYSLGNFVFYQPTDLYYRKVGFCLSLKVSGDAVAGIELHPYHITGEGLRRLSPGEEKRFLRKIFRISRPLSSPDGASKAWDAYLAYYGLPGFRSEVLGILERMKSEPEKGAAMFRNRITTMQHVELWRDFLTRIITGNKPPRSVELVRIVREWFEKGVGSKETL